MSSSSGVGSGVGDTMLICARRENGALCGSGEMSIDSLPNPGEEDSIGGVVTPSHLIGGVVTPSALDRISIGSRTEFQACSYPDCQALGRCWERRATGVV